MNDDELKNIEIEIARLKLERERIYLQDEKDKRSRNANTIIAAQSAISSTGNTLKKVLKFILGSIFGAIVSSYVCFLWVSKNRGGENFSEWTFNFGYWLGSGGFILIVVCAILGGFITVSNAPKAFMEGLRDGKK